MAGTRSTVSFTVQIKREDDDGSPVTLYLDPTGTFVADKGMAAKFRLHASPTQGERMRIEMRKHEIAGSYQDWADLAGAARRGTDRMREQIERQIWPKGRPEVKGKERLAQAEQIEAAWRDCDDMEMDDLRNLQIMLRRIDLLAAWDVLVVEVPAGWEHLSEREDDDGVFIALWNAYDAAMGAFEAGKR